MARPEILYGLATRGAQTGVTLLAAALVVWRMPTVAQGLYWGFASVGALVSIGELALSQVTLQTANYYVARGETERLRQFWTSARRLVAILVPLAALGVLALGALLFQSAIAGREDAPAWQWPWAAYVCLLAAAQLLGPAAAYIEGAVSITDAWRFQARMEAGSGVLLIAALALDAGLWSLALYALARCAALGAWLWRRRAQFPSRSAAGFGLRDWQKEILPYQWKLAISAVTAFLIFRAFTPIVLARLGPESAARFGLSLAVMGSWLSITVAWPASQTARIGQLASQGKQAELHAVFREMTAGSSALAALGALALLAALRVAEELGVPFGARSAGYLATALLLASAVLQHLVLCASVLLRSERRDPLLPYSVSGSLITAGALWYAAGLQRLDYVALAYFLCCCLGLAMGWHAFRANVKDWRYYLRPR